MQKIYSSLFLHFSISFKSNKKYLKILKTKNEIHSKTSKSLSFCTKEAKSNFIFPNPLRPTLFFFYLAQLQSPLDTYSSLYPDGFKVKFPQKSLKICPKISKIVSNNDFLWIDLSIKDLIFN